MFVHSHHFVEDCMLLYVKTSPLSLPNSKVSLKVKSKVIPRQAEVALGVPGRLIPRIFSTFGTTRVVGRQPKAPAAFTPGEIPSTHFQRLIRPQGTWFCRKEPRKKSQVTPPGIDSGTVRLVALTTTLPQAPSKVSLLVYLSRLSGQAFR